MSCNFCRRASQNSCRIARRFRSRNVKLAEKDKPFFVDVWKPMDLKGLVVELKPGKPIHTVLKA